MESTKEERSGFEARKKLISRESALKGWEGVEPVTVVDQCVSGANDLRFIGREFHKWGDKLRNEGSANLSVVETGGRERHKIIRGFKR